MNERVILTGNWKHGYISQAFVGATNVGMIDINFDPDLTTNNLDFCGKVISEHNYTNKGIPLFEGTEIGKFNLGSTVVAIVEVPSDGEFNISVGQSVRYGDVIWTPISSN